MKKEQLKMTSSLTEQIHYCPGCGMESISQRDAKRLECGECGFVYYHNVAAATVVMICHADELILTTRAFEPYKGRLDLPGGFLEPHETFEEGARREIDEELGIDLPKLEYLFSFPNIYPYRDIIYHTSDVYFKVDLPNKPLLTPGDDVSKAQWYHLDSIDLDSIAFASMRKAIALLKMQRKSRLHSV